MKPTAIPPALRSYFETGACGNQTEDDGDIFLLQGSEKREKAAWEDCREEIMDAWVKKYPATRPKAWWDFDSPRQPDRGSGAWFEGTLPEPRQRLSGTGTPRYEVLAYVPYFNNGIPAGWVSKFDEEYYNGRRKDIHGNPIGTEYKEGHFKGKAIDPDDPPTFESEAAYLQRHNLLSPQEIKYLAAHPELLQPEVLTYE